MHEVETSIQIAAKLEVVSRMVREISRSAHKSELPVARQRKTVEELMQQVQDRFLIEPNCAGTRVTRITEFEAGKELRKLVSVPKIKRAMRKVQFQLLTEVKTRAERNGNGKSDQEKWLE